MDIKITIEGMLTIQPDELNGIKAQDKNDLATLLIREGRDVKTDIRERYVKGGK